MPEFPSPLMSIPEIVGLSARKSIMRIPPDVDVPITPRVRKLIDTAEFRRLSQISQLGLVNLVYPGARHTRFEHCLGVYRVSLLFIQRLADDKRFAELVSVESAELLIATALLHDLGHWPYCHIIEDMGIPGLGHHEERIAARIHQTGVAEILVNDWGINPDELANLLTGNITSPHLRLLDSIISGPIDIDKMDYLYRDSLHSGVPYGAHFDRERLIGSLCLNEAGDRLAINLKGKTAAELMVFARYVMFSEVYWHHTVRAASAMLQRAVFLLMDQLDWDKLTDLTDYQFQQQLLQSAQTSNIFQAKGLIDGLFGPKRRIFKRVREFSVLEQPEIVSCLARKPFYWLVKCSDVLARLIEDRYKLDLTDWPLLIDAPPEAREVQFKVDIFNPKENTYRPLQTVSPVVRSLAAEQFDDFVKRVRLFADASVARSLQNLTDIQDLILEAAELTDQLYLLNQASQAE